MKTEAEIKELLCDQLDLLHDYAKTTPEDMAHISLVILEIARELTRDKYDLF